MRSSEASEFKLRNQLMNLLVVVLVFALMASGIWYFYDNEPDYQRQTLRLYASTYANNVQQANALWQVEGKPPRVLLVQYDKDMRVTDRFPVAMNHLGWPSADESNEGCEKLWRGLVGEPAQVDSFRVKATYVDGLQSDNDKRLSACRYRLSTGPYFEYFPFTGRLKTDKL